MIKKLTLEIEIHSIEDLHLILTEKSKWIWARDLTKGWAEWQRIRVWLDSSGYHGSEPKLLWSTDASDIKYTYYGKPPFTHYLILPDITFPG